MNSLYQSFVASHPVHLLWQVPAFIVGALLCWAIWLWLWHTAWPWASLILRILGKGLGKVGDALEFIPEKSKELATRAEHSLGLCHCSINYRCPAVKDK